MLRWESKKHTHKVLNTIINFFRFFLLRTGDKNGTLRMCTHCVRIDRNARVRDTVFVVRIEALLQV